MLLRKCNLNVNPKGYLKRCVSLLGNRRRKNINVCYEMHVSDVKKCGNYVCLHPTGLPPPHILVYIGQRSVLAARESVERFIAFYVVVVVGTKLKGMIINAIEIHRR